MVVNVKEEEGHTDENKGSAYRIVGTENGGRKLLVTERIAKSDKEEDKEAYNN